MTNIYFSMQITHFNLQEIATLSPNSYLTTKGPLICQKTTEQHDSNFETLFLNFFNSIPSTSEENNRQIKKFVPSILYSIANSNKYKHLAKELKHIMFKLELRLSSKYTNTIDPITKKPIPIIVITNNLDESTERLLLHKMLKTRHKVENFAHKLKYKNIKHFISHQKQIDSKRFSALFKYFSFLANIQYFSNTTLTLYLKFKELKRNAKNEVENAFNKNKI